MLKDFIRPHLSYAAEISASWQHRGLLCLEHFFIFLAAGAQPKLESDIKSETGVSAPTSRYSFILKLKLIFLLKGS
jgi:hypothetical protein